MPRATPARAAAPARPARAAATLQWNAAAGDEPFSARFAAVGAGVTALLFTAAALGMILGPHRIGDYMTETDFYGAYAQGARLVEHGVVDPKRYAVIGPLYEIALGLVGFVIHDLFLAAELLSLAASLITLGAWYAIVKRRIGPAAALFTVLFVATNAHFLRHAYSATTDAFAIALQAVTMLLLLGGVVAYPASDLPESPRGATVRLAVAGLAAGAAFLTRYNAIVLLPVGLAAVLAGKAGATQRLRDAAWFAAGFALPVVPWMLFSATHGGAMQLQLHHNIAYEVFARPHHIAWDDYQRRMQPQFHDLWDVIARDPGAVFGRMTFNVFDHLRNDAVSLLTPWVGVAALAGVLLGLRDGALARLWPAWLAGALLFLTLVPVISSERYSLAILPMYAALAALAFTSPIAALAPGAGRPWLKPLLAALPIAAAVMASVRVQKHVVDQLPVEVLSAARVLRQRALPGDGVIARKSHIAYHGGVEPLPFPFADSLPPLAAYAHQSHARWLYFSWPEAETRPALWYLLDTSSVVPGLTPRAVTRPHPAVLYEIGPGFGARPSWYANDTLFAYHRLRAQLLVDGNNPSLLFSFATVTRALRRWDEAERVAGLLARLRPDDPRALGMLGEVLLARERPADAERVFERLAAIDPGHPAGALGRGWALALQGRDADAARAWRPVVGATRDAQTLSRMVAVFTRVGDGAAAAAAQAALAGGAR